MPDEPKHWTIILLVVLVSIALVGRVDHFEKHCTRLGGEVIDHQAFNYCIQGTKVLTYERNTERDD